MSIGSLLLVNGTLLTMDTRRPRVSAALVAGERIAAVGEADDMRALAGNDARVIDLAGQTVVPGFNDAHCHALMFGLTLTQLDLKSARSIPDICTLVTDQARTQPAGTWIRGFGYDNNKLREHRHPTRSDLDAVAPLHPVVLVHTSGHMLVANSRSLELAGVHRDTPVLAGGRFVRDASGALTGLVQETAQVLVTAAIPKPTVAEMRRALQLASARMAAEGITSFQDARSGMFAPEELAAWQACSVSGELRQRVSLILDVAAVYPSDPPFGLGLYSGFGNDRLRIGGIKMFADGSLIGRTAAVSTPYVGETENRGFLTVEPGSFVETVLELHRRGWQLSVHAIGDVAIELVLDAYAHAMQVSPRPDPRHRIEHGGLLTPQLISRIADQQVIVVTQPRFASELGDGYLGAIGPKRLELCYPLASLLAAGAHVAASSDRPVVDGAPILGIDSAVNRRTDFGAPYAPDEAIAPLQALELFTVNAAYASFEEHVKGKLAPGYLADFAVLSDDPTRVPPAELSRIAVSATYVGGECIHESG
jgi:predicted amidohydrolase YtcJ